MHEFTHSVRFGDVETYYSRAVHACVEWFVFTADNLNAVGGDLNMRADQRFISVENATGPQPRDHIPRGWQVGFVKPSGSL